MTLTRISRFTLWLPIVWGSIIVAAGQSGPGPQTYTAPQVVAGVGLGFEFITVITLQSTFRSNCQAQVFLHRGAGQGVNTNLDVNGTALVNPLLVDVPPFSVRRLRISASPGEAGLFQGAAEITDTCNSLTITAGFDVVTQSQPGAAPAAAASVSNEIFNYDVKATARLLPNQTARAVVDLDLRGNLDGLQNIPGVAVVGDPDRQTPPGTDLCHQVFDPQLQPLTGVVCQPFTGGHQTFNINNVFQTLPDFNNAIWEMFLQGPPASGTDRPFADLLAIDVTDPNQFRPAPVDVVNPNCFGTDLCLNNDRFAVRVTGFNGTMEVDGQPEQVDDLSGLFFFPGLGDDNFELLVSMLDGCRFNNHFWVFGAAATQVEYTLTVVDSQTNVTMEYRNLLGNAAPPITDTSAFATCP